MHGRLPIRQSSIKQVKMLYRESKIQENIICLVRMENLCTAQAVLFLLPEMLNTERRSRWQRLRSAAGGGKSEQGLAQWSAFCENTKQKKAGTARGSVTVNHDAVGSSGAGGSQANFKAN